MIALHRRMDNSPRLVTFVKQTDERLSNDSSWLCPLAFSRGTRQREKERERERFVFDETLHSEGEVGESLPRGQR